MNMLLAVLTTDAGTGALAGGIPMLIFYVVIIGALMYFMIIRPQKKQQKQQDELMNSLEIGDSVCTTGGFYGVVIDKVDENVVIVEFGNNKNCRIPMKKTAIVEVEKPYDPNKAAKEAASTTPEEPKKSLFGKKDKDELK
ncbi:MAG: preprotein translocase subunit YajC [Lachnospiraceae bacterium]|nr:preprotein translocase subunit YajC [Lachnospiraceae bacterium]